VSAARDVSGRQGLPANGTRGQCRRGAAPPAGTGPTGGTHPGDQGPRTLTAAIGHTPSAYS